MIYKPRKIWRSKVKNWYITLDYSDDIDDGFFDYTQYGKSLFKPKVDCKVHTRNDMITYNNSEDRDELTKGLKIGDTASAESIETHKYNKTLLGLFLQNGHASYNPWVRICYQH